MKKDSTSSYLNYRSWKSDPKFRERIKAAAAEFRVASTKEPQPATRLKVINKKTVERRARRATIL
tara:strand:+ start:73 stop:267 length:195 start_codon:yes stop_codon:yes gene_type:complete